MEALQLIPSPEAAKVLCVKPQTLRRWRSQGTSPKYTRIGQRAFYRLDELSKWIDANTFNSLRDEKDG